MMHRLLCALCGLLSLSLAHTAAANTGDGMRVDGPKPPPPLQAQISYVSREVTPDGITQQHAYQERWIRDGNTLWSERLIPQAVVEAFHHHHDESNAPHKHFMYQMAARWISRQANGELALNYVDHYDKNQVFYPPNEYGQVGFVPDWEKLSHLFSPSSLALMSPELTTINPELLPKNGQDAHWYRLKQDDQVLRVLWSERLQLALEVDRQSLDGYKQYRMSVTLKPDLPTPRPWEQLAGYDQKEISDFFD